MKKNVSNLLHRFREMALRKRIREGRFVKYKSLKEMKSGLLFWTADGNDLDWEDNLMRKGWEGIHFDRLCFVPDGVECTVGQEVVRLCRKDFGLGGKIRNERLKEILSREYDLLIDLNPSSSPIINYVIANSHSRLVAGWGKVGGIADLRVAGVEKPGLFLDGLNKILSEIKEL